MFMATPTRREVKEQLIRLARDHQQGLPVGQVKDSVGSYLSTWLLAAQPTIRPSTFISYQTIVRLHLTPTLGAIALDKLKPADVRVLMTRELAAGLSARSVQYHHAVLRRALGQAVQDGLLARNVATLAKPPRVKRAEVRPLTPDQARTFLMAVGGDPLEALYVTALGTGLRLGELLGLRWSDVDLSTSTLSVHQAFDSRTRTLTEPKSERSRRTIALPSIAVGALQEHRRRQLEVRIWAGSHWQGEQYGLVFTTKTGTPLDAGNLTRRFHRILAGAALPRIRFHDLRHSAATFLLAQGVSPRVVMETLGHSQISLTMNTYAHVLPAMQRDAAERMDALLMGQSKA